MFHKRGYTSIESKDGKLYATTPQNDRVVAFLEPIEKLNNKSIENLIRTVEKLNISHFLAIYVGSYTPAVKTVLMNAENAKLTIELFEIEELAYDPTESVFTPEHHFLTMEEQKELRKQYGTSLPIILRTDPIARFYGMKRGQIIKIVRKNCTVAYRQVV